MFFEKALLIKLGPPVRKSGMAGSNSPCELPFVPDSLYSYLISNFFVLDHFAIVGFFRFRKTFEIFSFIELSTALKENKIIYIDVMKKKKPEH